MPPSAFPNRPRSLSRYYALAALLPALVSLLLTAAIAFYENSGYRSDWMTKGSVSFFTMLFMAAYCAILCLLSLTLYLNKLQAVRRRPLLSLLTWLALPYGFIAVVVVHEARFRQHYGTADFSPLYLAVINLPAVIGLIGTYFKFRSAAGSFT